MLSLIVSVPFTSGSLSDLVLLVLRGKSYSHFLYSELITFFNSKSFPQPGHFPCGNNPRQVLPQSCVQVNCFFDMAFSNFSNGFSIIFSLPFL